MKDEVTTEKSRVRQPHIFVFHIDSCLEKAEIKQKLLEQNKVFSEEEDIEVKHTLKGRRGTNWKLQLSPNIFSNFKKNKIKLGWSKYSFKEYLRPLCFKCGTFGHISRNCRNEQRYLSWSKVEQICKNCKESEYCCNCANFNSKFNSKFGVDYSPLAKTCHIRLKEINRLISKTKYE